MTREYMVSLCVIRTSQERLKQWYYSGWSQKVEIPDLKICEHEDCMVHWLNETFETECYCFFSAATCKGKWPWERAIQGLHIWSFVLVIWWSRLSLCISRKGLCIWFLIWRSVLGKGIVWVTHFCVQVLLNRTITQKVMLRKDV